MKILIHQLICGEVNKAWGLIKTTLLDIGIAKSIAFRADLQDQTSGVHWSPAIRGFSEGEYFLIMKTFEDTSADVRRGRKFSHVLIILKSEIVKIANLEDIINLLPKNIDKDTSLQPISLEIDSHKINNVPPELQGRFNKLINGYLNIKSHQNTLVWNGQESFDIAVIELWKRLTKHERQNFQFGIAFNNDNKGTDHINLFTVPDSVQSKFFKSDFYIIGKNDNHEPTELIEQWIIGYPSVQQRIHAFEKTIESKSLSREDINLVAIGIDTFEQMDRTNDLKKLNTLSNIIAKYSPSEEQGVDFKERLLNRIILLLETVSFADLIVLRNFKTESFKNSKKLLAAALIRWIKKYIFSVIKGNTEYKPFFEHIKPDKLNWWDKKIEEELKTFLNTIQVSKTALIYTWLTESPSILSRINTHIDKSDDSEKCFIKNTPKKISEELIEELKSFSINNLWLKLYAQLLNIQFGLKEALTELIKIDHDENHFEAINVIIAGKDQKQLVDYAVETGEVRMIKIAGKICHKSPKHLSNIDTQNINWQLIWAETINNGNQVGKGLKDAYKLIYEIFDGLLAENTTSEKLIKQISRSEFGNILSYPNRPELWERFPADVKNNFLAKTSAEQLQRLSQSPNINISNDSTLLDYMYQEGISAFLYSNKRNIKNVISLFEIFSQLSDNLLKEYIHNFSGSINAVEATQLGKLIAKRRFSNSAYLVNNKASKTNNWRFVLTECYFLLDFLTKAILVVSGTISNVVINADQWWQSTEELIVELYPNGTSLTTLWKKVGGKESDLITKGSASEIWSDVFYKLRKKQFKDITMNDLLKESKKQYGDNQKFKIIYELRKKFI